MEKKRKLHSTNPPNSGAYANSPGHCTECDFSRDMSIELSILACATVDSRA